MAEDLEPKAQVQPVELPSQLLELVVQLVLLPSTMVVSVPVGVCGSRYGFRQTGRGLVTTSYIRCSCRITYLGA